MVGENLGFVLVELQGPQSFGSRSRLELDVE